MGVISGAIKEKMCKKENKTLAPPFLHLCALKMRMEPLLFADENAPEWAFSKRKGVIHFFHIKKVGFGSTFFKGGIYRTMFLRHYIQQNVPTVSILLFIILFGSIQFMKPAFLYNQDGSIREFGVGYKNKTILPIWLLSLILGILSYLAVMYFVAYPRFL